MDGASDAGSPNQPHSPDQRVVPYSAAVVDAAWNPWSIPTGEREPPYRCGAKTSFGSSTRAGGGVASNAPADQMAPGSKKTMCEKPPGAARSPARMAAIARP